MKTSLNKLGIATFIRLGKKLKVKKLTICPNDTDKLDLNMDMRVDETNTDFIPVVYLWDWESGITRVEKRRVALGLMLETTNTKFSHIAIHLPAIKVLQIHKVNREDVSAWAIQDISS
jgi:hypothetical protein